MRRFGDFELAEDALQEAFAAAPARWPAAEASYARIAEPEGTVMGL